MSITYTAAKRKKICDYAIKHGKTKASELYGASRSSIDRWLSRYDGTKSTLTPYSRRPKSLQRQTIIQQAILILQEQEQAQQQHFCLQFKMAVVVQFPTPMT